MSSFSVRQTSQNQESWNDMQISCGKHRPGEHREGGIQDESPFPNGEVTVYLEVS
jgi:hypothetical protein